MEARLGVGALVISAMTLFLLFGLGDQGTALSLPTCRPVTIDYFALPGLEPEIDASARGTCEPFVYDMHYPLAVAGRVISDFGDQRDSGLRLHTGVDIGAPKLTPVLAVANGVVTRIHNDAGTADCCWLSVKHDDGWASTYVHLNNDLLDTDDGTTSGVRRDIAEGDRVTAGQVLGWTGDSGNAEDTTFPHLHFVLRDRAGAAVDPGPSVAAAAARTDFLVPDDLERQYRTGTVALSSLGLVWACDETGLMTCPDEPATVEDLTAIAVHLLGVDIDGIRASYGVRALHGDETPHEFLVQKLMGCPDDACRPHGVSRSELARLVASMSRRLISDKGVFETESDAHFHLPGRNEAISFLRFTGGVEECELPLDTSRLLTRGEAAYLLVDWLGLVEIDSCPNTSLPVR